MIFFDTTKTGTGAPRSGLSRVSQRLRAELGDAAVEVTWDSHTRSFGAAGNRVKPDDWLLTSELFSEIERPGFGAFVAQPPCRLAAIFHDAIPLKFPHTTWPQSVARHPAYLKLLASFDRVWAVSEASRRELAGFWQWQGVQRMPPIDVIALGADFNRQPRLTQRTVAKPSTPPRILCLGILEPRKNQLLLLDVCDELWSDGLSFELHLVGRVNPHFGAPIVARLHALQGRRGAMLRHHASATDETLIKLYASTRITAVPTLAEGCGLPLLESLWMNVPVVCSDLPPLQENAREGGCLTVPANDRAAWKAALRDLLTNDAAHAALVGAAAQRSLPRWSDAATMLRRSLG
jgi:glycosyltransferase involved in cell wall biosynthesis